jgi:hypothetical protein
MLNDTPQTAGDENLVQRAESIRSRSDRNNAKRTWPETVVWLELALQPSLHAAICPNFPPLKSLIA